MKQPRQSKGTPAGGQFGTVERDEADVSLTATPEDIDALLVSAEFIDVVGTAQREFPEATAVTFRVNDGKFDIDEVFDGNGRAMASKALFQSMSDQEQRDFGEILVDTKLSRAVLDDKGLTTAMADGEPLRVALPMSAADMAYARDRDWSFTSSDEAQAWQQAGFSAGEARLWRYSRLLSPLEAKAWRDAGYGPAAAGAWTEGGFGVDEAESWGTAGFDAVSAAEWRHTRFSPYGAAAYRRSGVGSAAAASEWDEAGWGAYAAGQWAAAGYSPSDAAGEREGYGRLLPSDMRDPIDRF